MLQDYDYELQHSSGQKTGNADALNRLPVDVSQPKFSDPADLLMFEMVEEKRFLSTRILHRRHGKIHG